MSPALTVETTALAGVLLVTPRRHVDARGYVSEPWDAARWQDAGLPGPWTTDVESYSVRPHTLRGLHAQRGQAKVVRCAAGTMRDVAVDARPGSPTFGTWLAFELSAANGRMVVIPAGVLHGFVTLAPNTLTLYRMSRPYDPDAQTAVRWDDPDLAIDWDLDHPPLLSDRDASARLFRAPET